MVESLGYKYSLTWLPAPRMTPRYITDYFLWILEDIVILQVRLWDIERGECVLILHNSDSFCRCVAFHGNIDQSYTAKIKYSLPGNRIVSGDFDGIVNFWEIAFNQTEK